MNTHTCDAVACHVMAWQLLCVGIAITVGELILPGDITRRDFSLLRDGSGRRGSAQHITHGRCSVIVTLPFIHGPLDISQVTELIAGV